jgi:hypothetical protein
MSFINKSFPIWCQVSPFFEPVWHQFAHITTSLSLAPAVKIYENSLMDAHQAV